MKSFSFFWLLLPVVALFFLLSYPDLAMTQDLGRHLKIGEIMTACHCVIHTNLFSFTEPNFPFIDHHWFSEVIFYWLFKAGGFPALLIFKITAISLSFGISFYLAYKKAGIKIASLIGLLFLFIFSERFFTRPELISFLCLSLFLWAIDEFKIKGVVRYLYFLPLVELLWTNAHIYFPVGYGLLFLLLIEQIFHKSSQWKLILVIFLATAAVTIINPNGLIGALYPLHVLDHYGYTIIENQSVFFLNTVFFNPRILVFEIVSMIFILAAFLQFKKLDFFWVSASVLAMISAFVMIRNFSLFVLTALPYTALLLRQVNNRLQPGGRMTVRVVSIITATVLFGFILYGRAFLQSTWFVYQPGAERAVAFFQKAGLKGPIFNNFDIGSYLIYRLYPQEKVFVDGRPEAYRVSFFTIYEKMQEDQSYFKQMENHYHLNTIVFAHTDITPWAQTFLSWIVRDSEWVPIYLDDSMVILVRNVPQNQQIISKYRISLSQ